LQVAAVASKHRQAGRDRWSHPGTVAQKRPA
jgi:hypothetical protein